MKKKGILLREGGHTIYVPPQPALAQLFRDIVCFYPDDAGFKILKDFNTVDKASYIAPVKRREISYTERVLTSSIPDIVDAANVMYLYGIGPCLYDVMEIHTGTATMTCFVVQHVSGQNPTPRAYSRFIQSLKSLIAHNVIALIPPGGLKHIDFVSPQCNRNLIETCDTRRPIYIDFQPFIVRDKSVIAAAMLSSFLEPSLRGREGLEKRGNPSKMWRAHAAGIAKSWSEVKETLAQGGLSVSGRLVLHVGCQNGGILGCALSEGALWGLGWDKDGVVVKAARLRRILGNTRFNLYASGLSESSSIVSDVPERLRPWLGESIVICSVDSLDVLPPSELRSLPWKALVLGVGSCMGGIDQLHMLSRLERDYDCKIAAGCETVRNQSGAGGYIVFRRS